MKSTAQKVTRATRPTLVIDGTVPSGLPTPADAPEEVWLTYSASADAELRHDGKELFARWTVTRSRTRGVTDADDGTGIALGVEISDGDKRSETFHLFGGTESRWRELSVEQFRRVVAALNAVAEKLPVSGPTTIRSAR